MAKLIMSLSGSVIREIPLDGGTVTIGRKPTNNVHIDNLGVSGEHARVVSIGNDWLLEDLDSTNGTLVNGALVKKHMLQPNDLIEVGKYRLKFIAERHAPRPAPAPAEEDIEKTMVLKAGTGAARPAIRRPPIARAPAPAGMLERLKSWFRSWGK
jgi:pSer/pThr/pTyr-binding forkhead associated (FHA) protein